MACIQDQKGLRSSAGVEISNRILDPSSDGQPTISVTSDVTVTGWLVSALTTLQYGGGWNSTFDGGFSAGCSLANCVLRFSYIGLDVGRRLMDSWSMVGLCGCDRAGARRAANCAHFCCAGIDTENVFLYFTKMS